MRRLGADCSIVVMSGVMPVERRGGPSPLTRVNGTEEPMFNGRRQPSRDGTSRMTREYQSGSVRGSGEIPRAYSAFATGSNQQQIRPCTYAAESGK